MVIELILFGPYLELSLKLTVTSLTSVPPPTYLRVVLKGALRWCRHDDHRIISLAEQKTLIPRKEKKQDSDDEGREEDNKIEDRSCLGLGEVR